MSVGKVPEVGSRDYHDDAAESLWDLLALSQDVVYTIGLDGTVTGLNQPFEDITGWEAEEWIGKPFAAIVHSDDLPAAQQRFIEAIQGIVSGSYRLRIRSKSGGYLTGQFRSGPHRVDGTIAGKIGIARDITPATRVAAASHFLAEASELLASSLDYRTTLTNLTRLAVPAVADWCAIDVAGEDGSIERLAVARADPATAQAAIDIDPEIEPLTSVHEAVIAGGQPVFFPDLSVEALASVPERIHLDPMLRLGMRSAMIVPLIARGRVLGAITFGIAESDYHYEAEDLALAQGLARHAALAVDNARLYGQAQDALRLREDFLSFASHELKTPLTSLNLQLQLLEKNLNRLGVADQQRASIERAMIGAGHQVRRLDQLVGELLDVSRIAAGRLDLQRADMDLAGLVVEVVDRFRESASDREIVVMTESIDGVWDRFRLDQVITNLVGNALKYGGDGRIDLSVGPGDGHAIVTVRDRGDGIPPAFLTRIFNRFERVPGNGMDGVGLGLYICRAIVEAHGGTIDVVSSAGGSTFTVRLPLSEI